MTKCADGQAKQALAALFRGELDGEGYTRLRAHAAGCEECREAYDKLGRVESVLEKRALPASREALLEKVLLERVAAAAKPARAPVPERKRFFEGLFMPAALGLAVCTVLVLLVVPRLGTQPAGEPEWRSRGVETGTKAWGLRAFCVGADGEVKGEARPGGTLVCGEGGAVQFSYTAPEGARLSVVGTPPGGEPLRFFPREGEAADISAGVDMLLPYSTPVEGGWLAGPLEVQASFMDARGRPLSTTRLTLSPR
ncbi:zf-HC2 domain-containing protein [Archangium violaceum]|uniref:zf-HC2 domain-containing protein n=1 Tax=Archangium violaceum TaxID=83451 RepID=UPI00194F0800|nr:zf-HC2 domain-containing protein [Archangium violaceum]QRN96555.1 zf-HC2 domain-containing protein [Archangium violaceum]